MRKIFTVSKLAGAKELFLFKVKDAYYWTYEMLTATLFEKEEEAESAINNMPKDTSGNIFMIKQWYVKMSVVA